MTADDPSDQEQLSDEPDHDSEGVPATGSIVPGRFSSDEVFQRIVADADHEITSSKRELFFSALAGGFAITITLLVYATMYEETGGGIARALLYPIGFIYIIIGGYQLYTENTLPPVALVLERLASVPALLRHWLIVAAGNFTGGAIGAIVLYYGNVFDEHAAFRVTEFAHHGIETPIVSLFFKGAFAGLVVAGVVWLDFSARDTISRLVIVYLAFLVIPLGGLFHVVVSFTESIFLVIADDVSIATVLVQFVIPVGLGNTVGGIVLVTIVNYYQTSERRLEVERFADARRLSLPEWLFGRAVGRSYVPLADTIERVPPDESNYRVMVPIVNPRTERPLLEFACEIAETRGDATVHAVHVVQTPERMGIDSDSGQHRRIVKQSEKRMAEMADVTDGYDVSYEYSTVVTHRSLVQVYDAARRTNPDLVVMGWNEGTLWETGRAEGLLGELLVRLPCDFLVAKDRGMDPSRVLVPTAGGPDSELSADVAQSLRDGSGADVSLLNVVDGPDEREVGELFLADWAEENGLADAEQIVDESGDVENAIVRHSNDHTLLVLGATERGMLARIVTDSLHLSVIDEVECSVVLAERPGQRSLLQRVFGRR